MLLLDGSARARLGLGLRAARRYLDDGMVDRAPALAYYGILSLFPFMLIGFAVLRLLGGSDAPAEIAEYVDQHGASGALSAAVQSAAETAGKAPVTGAGAAGAIGLLTVVYGASRAFTATGRAMDVVQRLPSTRRSPRRRAADIGWTLVLIAMTIAVVVLVAVSGRVLGDLLSLVGLEGEALSVWSVVRWPVAAAMALLIVAIVRWAAPTAHQRFRLFTPGILLSVGALALGTLGFNLYVSQLASYNSTYGAFAGAIVLLLWIWLGCIALLLGAELDAVLDEQAEPAP